MIAGSFRPYGEYKEAGARLLGAVPAHWRVAKMRGLVRLRTERNRIDLPLLSVARERGVFVRHGSGEENHNVIPDDLSNYKVARGGDLVVNKMKAWQGSMGIAPCDGIVSPAYFVFRLAVDDVRYGQALLRSRPYVGMFAAASDGVRVGQWDLSIAGLREIPVLLPPQDEQAAIVRFLDYANGRLERAIRAKRKVIALLQEQKQAIIQRAVTVGLNPSVPLRPSTVPWLGSFPQHWEIRRLSSVAKFASGRAHEHFVDADGQHVCVTARFVSTGGQSRKTCTKNFSPAQRNDVLMVMSDLPNGRALARAYLVEDDASYAVNQRVCILRPHSMDPQFLAYAANRNRGLTRHDDGSNQTHLSNGDFKTLPIQCPPRAEQEAIVATVRPALAGIERQLALVIRQIDLLQEYRTRLTADVVTGKLDVREPASRISDAPPEADSLSPEAQEDIEEEVVGT